VAPDSLIVSRFLKTALVGRAGLRKGWVKLELRRILLTGSAEMVLNPIRAPLVSSSFKVACVTGDWQPLSRAGRWRNYFWECER
jgi:hypothetical protein